MRFDGLRHAAPVWSLQVITEEDCTFCCDRLLWILSTVQLAFAQTCIYSCALFFPSPPLRQAYAGATFSLHRVVFVFGTEIKFTAMGVSWFYNVLMSNAKWERGFAECWLGLRLTSRSCSPSRRVAARCCTRGCECGDDVLGSFVMLLPEIHLSFMSSLWHRGWTPVVNFWAWE